MILVTGGAGFIGSNIVKALNQQGEDKIIIIDDLTDGKKFKNLIDLHFIDYVDKAVFIQQLSEFKKKYKKQIRAVFHQGACSDTTEWDGKFMLANNYDYSKQLFHFCQDKDQPVAFIYASSASVYGLNSQCVVSPAYEQPLNIYGYSKLLFDRYVRQQADPQKGQVVGLRYFNVYGPREQHKGKMASVAFHCHQQLLITQTVNLFAASGGYANGEQRRDFIYVKDIAAVNLWLFNHPEISGIFNLGTGQSQSFNDVANAVIQWHGRGNIQYIDFPENLKKHYQHFTQADIHDLRAIGYQAPFQTVSEGIKDYLDDISLISIE